MNQLSNQEIIYMNSAQSGKYSSEVIFSIEKIFQEESHYGGGSPYIQQIKGEIQKKSRQMLAHSMNVLPEEIVLTQNTTEGINILSQGLDFRYHDEIIITSSEHYSCVVPWKNIVNTKGVTLKTLQIEECYQHNIFKEELFIQQLQSLITNKTRALFLSHILYDTGLEIPVKKICALLKKYPIEIIIDGAQAFGHIPVDLSDLGCHYYAFTCSKWLNGPSGTGGLYIQKDRINSIKPVFSGYMSITSHETWEYKQDAGCFEVSTKSAPLLNGMITALEQYNPLEKFSCILANTARVQEILQSFVEVKIISPQQNGIITFQLSEIGYLEVFNFLIENGIICRTIDELEAIRFAVPPFLSEENYDRLFQVLRSIFNN